MLSLIKTCAFWPHSGKKLLPNKCWSNSRNHWIRSRIEAAKNDENSLIPHENQLASCPTNVKFVKQQAIKNAAGCDMHDRTPWRWIQTKAYRKKLHIPICHTERLITVASAVRILMQNPRKCVVKSFVYANIFLAVHPCISASVSSLRKLFVQLSSTLISVWELTK